MGQTHNGLGKQVMKTCDLDLTDMKLMLMGKNE